MYRSAVIASVATLAGVFAFPAEAGPDWIEGGEKSTNFLPDAGPLPGSAQRITGSGPINTIFGRLSGMTEGGSGGDFQDMYLIHIDTFDNFFVSTQQVAVEGTSFLYDTSLFLFTGPDHPLGAGVGIFANLLGQGSLFGEAVLGNFATDDSIIPELIGGMDYYLAIAGAGTLPVDAYGNLIFSFGTNPYEVSGPDGEAGFNPIAGWVGEGAIGEYFVPNMFGVSAVPTPGAVSLLTMSGLAAVARRRRAS